MFVKKLHFMSFFYIHLFKIEVFVNFDPDPATPLVRTYRGSGCDTLAACTPVDVKGAPPPPQAGQAERDDERHLARGREAAGGPLHEGSRHSLRG